MASVGMSTVVVLYEVYVLEVLDKVLDEEEEDVDVLAKLY